MVGFGQRNTHFPNSLSDYPHHAQINSPSEQCSKGQRVRDTGKMTRTRMKGTELERDPTVTALCGDQERKCYSAKLSNAKGCLERNQTNKRRCSTHTHTHTLPSSKDSANCNKLPFRRRNRKSEPASLLGNSLQTHCVTVCSCQQPPI